MSEKDTNVRVLERAFDILEVLAMAEGSVGISELAKSTDMSKSTIYRLVSTMYERGYVDKTIESEYTIGAKMFETVSYHINSLELQTESKPYLANLRREVDLTTHLGVLDGPYVVYVEKISLHPGTRLYTQVGYRSPAYCSSMGKCLLACLSGEELDETLYHYEFEKFTQNTYTDKAAFKRYLHKVRKQGWAMDNEEYQIGNRCVGAPVFDYRGDAVAAISASGTIEDLSDDKLEWIVEHVKKAALDISKRMGYVIGT
ncbi:MAG: IclR family transcriptional regulator [Lachnospiraceae bacterium]|nr:IclR family transcriptional regulator [Lachnospiraceae bacterium]